MRPKLHLSPAARARWQQRLATGGAITAMRQRGSRWDDLARAFNLTDDREARKLAGEYLLANTNDREDAQDRAEAGKTEP